MKRVVLSLVIALLLTPGLLFAQEPEGPSGDAEPDVEAGLARVVKIVARAAEKAETDARRLEEKRAWPKSRSLTVLTTGDLHGRIAEPTCRGEGDSLFVDDDMTYARQARWVRTLDELQAGTQEPPPVMLNLGDSIFPGVLSRFLLARGEPGARNLVSILTRIPYDAMALGNLEFGVSRGALIDFLNVSREARLPVGAANVVCNSTGGAEAICETLGTAPKKKPYTVVERDGVRIAIVSVIDNSVVHKIAESRHRGLDFLDEKDVLDRVVSKIREENAADLVFATYHIDGSKPDRAHDLASGVSGIDVMFTSELFGAADSGERGSIVASGTGTYVIDGASGPSAVVTSRLKLVKAGDDKPWRVVEARARTKNTGDMPPEKTAASMLEDAAGAFCEEWGTPLSDTPLTKPFSAANFQVFALNTMRFQTESEVALMNARAFRNLDRFPIEDHLTRADVYGTLPFSDRIVTADIPGAKLVELKSQLGDSLAAAGLEVSGGDLYVNGRQVNTNRAYSVALTDFLATGGDSLLDPESLSGTTEFEPEWSEDPATVNDLVIHFVEEGQFARDGEMSDVISAEGNFPNLHNNFLWTFTGSVNASYTTVAVESPQVDGEPAFESSQLSVSSTDQINLEGNWGTTATARNHEVVTELLAQYATARVEDGDDTGFEETKDLIRANGIYKWLYPRSEFGGLVSKRFLPIPYAELEMESEFDPPDDRDWRRMQGTGIVGLAFRLFEPFEVRVGINARREFLKPDATTTAGLTAGYSLSRIKLLEETLGSPIEFESSLDYFFNDIGNSNIHEIRHQNRLFFNLVDRLFFTSTFAYYALRNDDVGEWGTNREFMVGLNYVWESVHQSF